MPTKKEKPLRTYSIAGWAYLPLYTRVRARSKKEAREIAEARGVKGFCHSCMSSRHGEADREFCAGDHPDQVTITEVLEDSDG